MYRCSCRISIFNVGNTDVICIIAYYSWCGLTWFFFIIFFLVLHYKPYSMVDKGNLRLRLTLLYSQPYSQDIAGFAVGHNAAFCLVTWYKNHLTDFSFLFHYNFSYFFVTSFSYIFFYFLILIISRLLW